jgi:hypothetical protein
MAWLVGITRDLPRGASVAADYVDPRPIGDLPPGKPGSAGLRGTFSGRGCCGPRFRRGSGGDFLSSVDISFRQCGRPRSHAESRQLRVIYPESLY